MNVKKMESECGCKKLCSDGYIYVFDKWSADMVIQFWRCERKSDWKGRVHERDGKVTFMVNQHSQIPNPGRIEAMSCVTVLKHCSIDTDDTMGSLISNGLE